MVTQPASPSVFSRSAEIFSATARDRGCDAPSGRMDTRIAYPWSSVGRNPVGWRTNPQAVTPTMTAKSTIMSTGCFTIRATVPT